MPLTVGTRLGPYEVVAPLGAGGMGEVYKARDTRLDRTVAIKILPEILAVDPQFRERFDREAKSISQLSHPNICTLFDVGHQNGIDFLVLEYLEGETLAARLEQRSSLKSEVSSLNSESSSSKFEGSGLPPNDALRIAIDICSALDTAHRAGIVHRDLKPGNVILTKGGAKLLDFGLAKTSAPAITGSKMTALATTPPSITAQGTILGTMQYMSPEQIEGLEADARTDIFAFGCVLYEMLTGRTAFQGKTRASLLGAILKDEPPPISQAQPFAPPSLSRIVQTCLEKDPDDRWQTARDLLRELKWAADSASTASVGAISTAAGSPASATAPWQRMLPWAAASALAVGLAVVLALWAPWRPIVPSTPLRLNAEVGAGSLAAANVDVIALSPDGLLLAFVAQKAGAGVAQLHLRRLDQLQATPLSGTDDATAPFFSPDGQWIAFFADGKLKKISVTGGGAVTLCDAPGGRGGSWGDDGTIVFTPNSTPNVTLMRVSSAGGKPEAVMKLADGEITERWPQVLPGGKAVLYSGHSSQVGWDEATIVVQPLPTGERKTIQRGGYHARYLPSGHLVYIHESTLFAAPFSLDRLEIAGQPVPVLEGVTANTTTGGAQFTVAANGTLVYLPGRSLGSDVPVQWMDRDGKTTSLRATPTVWTNPHFSPDGRQLALEILDGKQSDIWVYDWARDTPTKLTFDPNDDVKPVWTPDSRRIVFGSRRGDKTLYHLYWQRADGTGEVQQLTESKANQAPASWHPSGKFLAFSEQNNPPNADLMILTVEGDETSGWKPRKPTVFLSTQGVLAEPMFSPDGRWLAYSSNESGRNEIYVRPFPGPGGPWQVSTNGGV